MVPKMDLHDPQWTSGRSRWDQKGPLGGQGGVLGGQGGIKRGPWLVKEGSWEAQVGKGTKMERQGQTRTPSATPKETPKGGQGGPKMTIRQPTGGASGQRLSQGGTERSKISHLDDIQETSIFPLRESNN